MMPGPSPPLGTVTATLLSRLPSPKTVAAARPYIIGELLKLLRGSASVAVDRVSQLPGGTVRSGTVTHWQA